MAYFKIIPTQVCVVLKSLLSKAIARYRARVMALRRHHSRSHKSKNTAVFKMPFETMHGAKMHQDVLTKH